MALPASQVTRARPLSRAHNSRLSDRTLDRQATADACIRADALTGRCMSVPTDAKDKF